MSKSQRSTTSSLVGSNYSSRKFIVTLYGLTLIAIIGLCGVANSGAVAGAIALLASAYIGGNVITKGQVI